MPAALPSAPLPMSADPANAFGCTCSAVRKAARRISALYDQSLEPYGLTITQFGLMAKLHEHGPEGIGALAQRMIMDPTTLTRNLRPLERQGFIRFEPDPNDRRARCPVLTDDGRTVLRRARAGWHEAQRKVADGLGGDELRALHQVLATALERLAP